MDRKGMGTSEPPEPRWADDAPPAERRLWRWAVEQLPDRVRVVPNVAMTVATGGRPEEAEIDLVLVDPDGGVTVMEVKGGTMSYDAPHAQWYRHRGDGGRKEVRDPVQQAKRARSHLRTALDAGGFDVASTALRWAVAVPDCRLDAPGGVVLDQAQLWDERAVDGLELSWQRTVGGLTTGEQALGDTRTDAVVSFLRGRSRDGRPSLRADIDQQEAAIRVHTESHRLVLNEFAHNRRVLVRGSAGTGKTVLAIEAAARQAASGDRVLLGCWNLVLAGWLQEALRARLTELQSPVAELVTDDPTGQVVVGHLAGLARGSARAQGLNVPKPPAAGSPQDEFDHHYHEVLPELLTAQACGGEFDTVVLDEAQDLRETWVLAAGSLVGDNGRWIAFTDRQQDLFRSSGALPDFLELDHELRENFRNSQQIAEVASWFGDIETDCVAGDGPPVRFVSCPSNRVQARTTEVARKLQRDEHIEDADLAVLWVFHNPFKGRTDEVAEQTRNGELVQTNSASFKGMERPVVVLGLDMKPNRPDSVDNIRRAVYAAITRARSHLVVVGDPDLCRDYGFAEMATHLAARDADDGDADA